MLRVKPSTAGNTPECGRRFEHVDNTIVQETLLIECSRTFEASASELLENHEEMFPFHL